MRGDADTGLQLLRAGIDELRETGFASRFTARLEDGPGAAAAAERHFRQALEWARRQGALGWELRAATSLARMWRNQGRTKEARELLAPVYDRFTEGFGSLDLKIAKSLLDQFDSYRT